MQLFLTQFQKVLFILDEHILASHTVFFPHMRNLLSVLVKSSTSVSQEGSWTVYIAKVLASLSKQHKCGEFQPLV